MKKLPVRAIALPTTMPQPLSARGRSQSLLPKRRAVWSATTITAPIPNAIRIWSQYACTHAIARKSYVHPSLIALVKTGQSTFRKALRLPRAKRYMSREECGLITFLEAGTPAVATLAKAA